MSADVHDSRIARVARMTEDSTTRTPWRAGTAIAFALLLPPFLALLLIALYGVNGPTWDHLNSAELFDRWDRGTLTWHVLMAPHNEHRKVVPRLVVLGLGLLTKFNVRVELFFQWLLLCAAAALMWRAFRSDVGRDGRTAAIMFVPIVCLLFSLRQYEILLIGEGLLTYLSLLFLVAAIYALVWRPPTRLNLVIALVSAVGASLSQSNGLLIWPIGMLVVITDRRTRSLRVWLERLAVWALSASLVVGLYFRGYVDPGNHPTPAAVLAHPMASLTYFLMLGGTPFSFEPRSAAALGLAVLVSAAIVAIRVARAWRDDGVPVPFGAWLGLCAIASQAMITLNRAVAVPHLALQSRYAAYLGLAPIGVYWCALALRRWTAAPKALAQYWLAGIACAMVWGLLTINAWMAARYLASAQEWGAYVMYTAKYQPLSLLAFVYPNPLHARAYSATLERLNLNVFAENRIDAAGLTATMDPPPFHVDSINQRPADGLHTLVVAGDEIIVVDGWALGAGGRKPPPGVFLTLDGSMHVPVFVGIDRPDVGKTFGRQAARLGGFRGTFSAAVLAPGPHMLALTIAIDRTRKFVTDSFVTLVKVERDTVSRQ